jgi:phosphoglycerate dehydrogenase-like enzyme
MHVEGVARSVRPPGGPFERLIATGDGTEIHRSLGEADYVVDALPLTPETRELFGRGEFESMRPTARFINIGRGETVDEAALAYALGEGSLAGAALDVFETEPLAKDSPLWGMENVIVSPHMSGDLVGWERAVVDVFLDNLDRWLRDEPLRNVVHKSLGYVPTT